MEHFLIFVDQVCGVELSAESVHEMLGKRCVKLEIIYILVLDRFGNDAVFSRVIVDVILPVIIITWILRAIKRVRPHSPVETVARVPLFWRRYFHFIVQIIRNHQRRFPHRLSLIFSRTKALQFCVVAKLVGLRRQSRVHLLEVYDVGVILDMLIISLNSIILRIKVIFHSVSFLNKCMVLVTVLKMV